MRKQFSSLQGENSAQPKESQSSLLAKIVKNSPAIWKTWIWSLGWEDPLEEGMATHRNILAWRIPMDRGAWWTTVHRVAKNQISLSDFQFSSIQFSLSVVSNSLQPHGLQHARSPCPSPTPGVYSNSSSLSQWCHPTISSSVVPFSCLQTFPASRSSYQYWSIGASASASVLLMNIQDWFPLGWTGWISLQKGPSRVFSNTTV